MNRFSLRSLVQALLVMFVCIAQPARSETGYVIDAHRIDLTDPAQVASLLQRIRRAAQLVCQASMSAYEADKVRSYRRCVEMATSDAVAHAKVPALTELYASREPK